MRSGTFTATSHVHDRGAPAASALLFSGAALLDAEKLDAYRVALEFQAMAGQLVPKRGCAELRDQLERASICGLTVHL